MGKSCLLHSCTGPGVLYSRPCRSWRPRQHSWLPCGTPAVVSYREDTTEKQSCHLINNLSNQTKRLINIKLQSVVVKEENNFKTFNRCTTLFWPLLFDHMCQRLRLWVQLTKWCHSVKWRQINTSNYRVFKWSFTDLQKLLKASSCKNSLNMM